MKRTILSLCVASASLGFMANTAVADLSNGLVAHYPFDGNARDASGYGNHGVLQGNVTFVDGKVGQAAFFNGEKDYISVADDGSLDVKNNMTISMFINPHYLSDEVFTDNGPNGLVFKEKAYVFRILQSKLDHDFHNGTKWDGVGATRNHLSQDNLSLNQWYFVALTFNGHVTRFFFEGNLVETIEHPVSINNSDNELRIGWQWDNRYWHGLIDELRIYNRTLSNSEIEELHNDQTGCDEPVTDCPTDPSHPDDCMAAYSVYGKLHIPCVSVGTTVYEVDLQKQLGSFTFDLDLNSVKPR